MMAKKNKAKKGKKKLLAVLCILLVLCIVIFAVGFNYWESLKEAPPPVEDTMTYDFDAETQPTKLEDDPVFDQIFEGNASEFKESIRQWATNGGDVMYDEDVINVLCVGVDTRNKNTVSGLTDSMIVVSVNRELGTITMTSIMRDSFAYLESPDGVGSFNKINSAFPFYGINNLTNTIQSHFKIRIDGYAMINFSLFKAVIDKLGGVDVPVQQYEADYLNRGYNFDIVAGSSVNLNGDEALAFCRSRNCDSDGDVSRTRRQRQTLSALLRKAAKIDPSEIMSYVETFMPYLETSYTESEVASLAMKAVVGGWATFDVNQLVIPDENSREAHSGSVWYWAVDYPLAAQTLQMAIYGKTNIQLDEDRVSPLDLN